MRFYRLMTYLALWATIGSFALQIWMAMPSDENSEAVQGKPRQKSTPPQGSSVKKTDALRTTACEKRLYEAALPHLKQQDARRFEPDSGARYERIGEDQGFIYFYDRSTDEVSCVARLGPAGSVVLAGRAGDWEERRRKAILVCVAVIVLASLALAAVQAMRYRQSCD